MNWDIRMDEDRALIDAWLKRCFDGQPPRADLYDAMKYSLEGGGKRIRPILTLEVCRMCGGDPETALPFACAVEMIHTYSLIHDDLPCMDDDDLRRGRPTNHRVFGEAMAVLAGDGLLTAAFETMLEAEGDISPQVRLEAARCLAHAAGARGMVGGQALDMAGEGHALTRAEVEEIEQNKTGALISAAAEMGCIIAGGSQEDRAAVRDYARLLGLAFQVRDDMLDCEGTTDELGKTVGSDHASEKATFVSLMGLDACRTYVRELTDRATAALDRFPQADFLRWLAQTMAERTR